jgi:type II secretory pathway component GspD/PulD (secretin)
VYQEGALSITAEDATLREIFDSVRQSTGAAIDAPATEERVSVHLGPQPPVQVIAALLEGTPFNYAILGGTGPADRVLRIIVMPKPAGAPPASHPQSEEAAARVRAKTHRGETGSDEGVWDNNEPEAPAQPATAPLPQQRVREHK